MGLPLPYDNPEISMFPSAPDPIRRTLVIAAVASAFVFSACQSMQGMKTDAPLSQKPLYDRLGGQPAITAVVDDFVGNVAGDSHINGFFARTDIPRLKKNLADQICAGTGGPCAYSGKDMRSAHKGMNITDAQFNALVEDLVKTLDKFKVPATEKGELLAILAPMKPQILGQ
jgi:hemoglobin